MNLEYLRSFRILEVAMFDYVMSYIGMAIIIQILGLEHKVLYYMMVMPIAVLAHYIIGQDTTIMKALRSEDINLTKVYFIFLICAILYNLT